MIYFHCARHGRHGARNTKIELRFLYVGGVCDGMHAPVGAGVRSVAAGNYDYSIILLLFVQIIGPQSWVLTSRPPELVLRAGF